jgi:hypothetical protein
VPYSTALHSSAIERLPDGTPPDVGAGSAPVAARLEKFHFLFGALSGTIDGYPT